MISVMRRVILLFAAVLLASIGWSQTMVVTLNDGTTVKYDMGIVKSIEFTDEDSGNSEEAIFSIVGTWKTVFAEGWGHSTYSDEDGVEYMQFKADGSFVNVQDDEDGINIQHGTWTMTDNELILRFKDGKLAGSSFTYTILEKETNKLTVSLFGFTGYLIRVSDSEIEKYL